MKLIYASGMFEWILSLIPAGVQSRSLSQATGFSSRPTGLTPIPGLLSPGLGGPSRSAAGRTMMMVLEQFKTSILENAAVYISVLTLRREN